MYFHNMVSPYNVKFNPEIVFGNPDYSLTLTRIKETLDYNTKKFVGYSFYGINENLQMVCVKVPYEKPVDDISKLDLNGKESIHVRFTGVVVKIYVNNDNYAAFSVKAEKMEVLD